MVFKRTKRFAKSAFRAPFRAGRYAFSGANTANKALAIATLAAKNAHYLKGLVNSEMLHKDNTLTLGSNQSTIFGLTNIAQGDSSSDRTGNSLLLKNIYIRGTIQINAATVANTRCTFLLIKDKQQVSDTSPAITDIVVSATDPDTLLNTGTFGRFKVLWRKSYALTPVAGGRNVIEFSKYWKLYDHVRYNGSANTDIQRNGYYLVLITSEGTNFPTAVFNARTGYHDN